MQEDTQECLTNSFQLPFFEIGARTWTRIFLKTVTRTWTILSYLNVKPNLSPESLNKINKASYDWNPKNMKSFKPKISLSFERMSVRSKTKKRLRKISKNIYYKKSKILIYGIFLRFQKWSFWTSSRKITGNTSESSQINQG